MPCPPAHSLDESTASIALGDALDTLDADAIIDLAGQGFSRETVARFLHDACSLVARKAKKQGRPELGAGMLEALERLAPGQALRLKDIAKKPGSTLGVDVITLDDPAADEWLVKHKIALDRAAALALADRWIGSAGAVDLDCNIPFKAGKRESVILTGVRGGIGVLRGDSLDQIQDRIPRESSQVSVRVGTGLMRVASRSGGGRWPAEQWTPQAQVLAWVHEQCNLELLMFTCTNLLRIPPETINEIITPLLVRLERSPIDLSHEQIQAATPQARRSSSSARL